MSQPRRRPLRPPPTSPMPVGAPPPQVPQPVPVAPPPVPGAEGVVSEAGPEEGAQEQPAQPVQPQSRVSLMKHRYGQPVFPGMPRRQPQPQPPPPPPGQVVDDGSGMSGQPGVAPAEDGSAVPPAPPIEPRSPTRAVPRNPFRGGKPPAYVGADGQPTDQRKGSGWAPPRSGRRVVRGRGGGGGERRRDGRGRGRRGGSRRPPQRGRRPPVAQPVTAQPAAPTPGRRLPPGAVRMPGVAVAVAIPEPPPPPPEEPLEETPLEEEPLAEEPLEEEPVSAADGASEDFGAGLPPGPVVATESPTLREATKPVAAQPAGGGRRRLPPPDASAPVSVRRVRARRPPPSSGQVTIKRFPKKRTADTWKQGSSEPESKPKPVPAAAAAESPPLEEEPLEEEPLEEELQFDIEDEGAEVAAFDDSDVDDDDVPDDAEALSEFYDVDEGSSKPVEAPKIVPGTMRGRSEAVLASTKRVQVALRDLPPHKTGRQYMAPRYDVVKEHARVRIKAMALQRVWEVNFADKVFINMRRKDFLVKKSIPFKKLLRVKMDTSDPSKFVLVLVFKNVHPYRLQCGSKKDLIRFYECAKLAITNYTVWSPRFVQGSSRGKAAQPNVINQVQICGKFHYEHNKAGNFVVEERELMDVRFNCASAFEETIVWCGTWNLGGKPLPRNHVSLDSTFVRPNKDVYVICLQEAARKPENFVTYFKKYFKKRDAHLVQFVALNGVILMAFVPRRHARKVSCVNIVKHAYPKQQGGRAAVLLRFHFNETVLCFIGTQLCTGEENCRARRGNLAEIWNVMNHPGKFSSFGHCFLMGDLNYRISLPPSVAARHVQKQNYGKLIIHDQLTRLSSQGGVLVGWLEGNVTKFAPTYPCTDQEGPGGRAYVPNRTPSYTDRILYRSQPSLKCQLVSYESSPDLNVSLHTPVHGTFMLDTQRCHVSHFSPPVKQVTIRFAEVFCSGRFHGGLVSEPYLEIRGEFLEVSPTVSTKLKNYVPVTNPIFVQHFIPPLKPVLCDPEFLKTQCLVLSLYDGLPTQGGSQLLGTACLPLMMVVSGGRQSAFPFQVPMESHLSMRASLCGTVLMA